VGSIGRSVCGGAGQSDYRFPVFHTNQTSAGVDSARVRGFGVGVLEHLGHDQPGPVALTLQGPQREVVAIQRCAANEPLAFDLEMRGDQHQLGCQHPETGLRWTGKFAAVEIVVSEQAPEVLDDFGASPLDRVEGVDPVSVVGLHVL